MILYSQLAPKIWHFKMCLSLKYRLKLASVKPLGQKSGGGAFNTFWQKVAFSV